MKLCFKSLTLENTWTHLNWATVKMEAPQHSLPSHILSHQQYYLWAGPVTEETLQRAPLLWLGGLQGPGHQTQPGGASWGLVLMVRTQTEAEGHHGACALSYPGQPGSASSQLSPPPTLPSSASGSTFLLVILLPVPTTRMEKQGPLHPPKIGLLAGERAQLLLMGPECGSRWESSRDNHTPWLLEVLGMLRRLGI